ncbi:GrpE protein mitochondrial [Fasciola hepatica]|uniref:GrpE protein mitochondrial n=1 Tax=Fasciola hepatica TaxID=6192 RepID=A0A4E0RT59_FASHE|nr:GrpE protein mitochondrial [Fasciola hepatica]
MSLYRAFSAYRVCGFLRLTSYRLIASKPNSTQVDDKSSPAEDVPQTEAQTGAPEDLQLLKSENEKLICIRNELEDKYKRSLAESENMRKRLMRQIDEAKIFGIQSFCKDLLEVADILTKATEITPEEQSDSAENSSFRNLFEGLKLTEQQLLKVFERHHLVRIQPAEGDLFDPNIHEAVFQAPLQEGKKPNTVAVVTKVGYKLHQRTLRPAYVGVFGS